MGGYVVENTFVEESLLVKRGGKKKKSCRKGSFGLEDGAGQEKVFADRRLDSRWGGGQWEHAAGTRLFIKGQSRENRLGLGGRALETLRAVRPVERLPLRLGEGLFPRGREVNPRTHLGDGILHVGEQRIDAVVGVNADCLGAADRRRQGLPLGPDLLKEGVLEDRRRNLGDDPLGRGRRRVRVAGEGLLGGAAGRRRDVARTRGAIERPDAHGELQALTHAMHAAHGGVEGGGSGDVLEELLAHASAAVLGVLKLGHPVIDGGIKLSKGFFLLENGIVAELGRAGRSQVLADARVKVASAGPERSVGATKVLGALVQLAKLLDKRLNSAHAYSEWQGLTRDRLSTSSFRNTSNRAACWSACFCSRLTSAWQSMSAASLAFHPLGNCSKARRSALLLLPPPVLFRTLPSLPSVRFLGRPLSMMLPVSEWFLRCPLVGGALCGGCGSALSGLGVELLSSGMVSFGVPEAACFSHGLGDARASIGAVTGVGRVDVVMVDVAADMGVKAAERGVKGVRIRGESSVLAERIVGSRGVLPDRRRLREICWARRGTAAPGAGITSGAKLLGESGGRPSLCNLRWSM